MEYIPELRESLSKPDWRYCRVCSGNAVWFKSEWLRLDPKTKGTKLIRTAYLVRYVVLWTINEWRWDFLKLKNHWKKLLPIKGERMKMLRLELKFVDLIRSVSLDGKGCTEQGECWDRTDVWSCVPLMSLSNGVLEEILVDPWKKSENKEKSSNN